MSKYMRTVEIRNHKYQVTPVEGSDDKYVVIKDSVQTRFVTFNELHSGLWYDVLPKLFEV